MVAVFLPRPHDRFIEIQWSGERNLIERIKASIFLEVVLAIEVIRAPIQFRKDRQRQHLKRCFFWRTDPSIFTSIAPVLLDWSNETSWVFPVLKSTSHLLPQSRVSSRSDSSSEVNSTCCYRLDTWSHLE